jgi:hypothetical protein
MRLGEAEATDDLAARHARQEALALRLTAVGENRVHAQGALHRHEAAQPRIAPLEFLADEAVGHRVQPRTTIALKGAAQQAQRGEPRDQFARESVVLEVAADHRQHLMVDETADLLLDKPLVVVQLRADVEEVERVEFRVGHVHSSSVIIEECICYPRASASDAANHMGPPR